MTMLSSFTYIMIPIPQQLIMGDITHSPLPGNISRWL